MKRLVVGAVPTGRCCTYRDIIVSSEMYSCVRHDTGSAYESLGMCPGTLTMEH